MKLEEIVVEDEEVLEEIQAPHTVSTTSYAKILNKIDTFYEDMNQEIKAYHKKLRKQLKKANKNNKILNNDQEVNQIRREFLEEWRSYLKTQFGENKLIERINFDKKFAPEKIPIELYKDAIKRRIDVPEALESHIDSYITATSKLYDSYRNSLTYSPSEGKMIGYALLTPLGAAAVGGVLCILNPVVGITTMSISGTALLIGAASEGYSGYPLAKFMQKRKIKKAYKEEKKRLRKKALAEYKNGT